MKEFEFHPIAELFPLMDDADADALGDDIKSSGLHEPIWEFEDKILDGRNRYRQCIRVGVEPTFRPYLGDDPLGFVISLNLTRRHLSDAQRSMVAGKLATLRKGNNQHSPIGETSQAKAAKMLNVSKRGVERAREVIDRGVPELVNAVEQGKVAVSTAAEFAKATQPIDQARLIAEHGSPADAVKATVKAKADRAEARALRKVPDVSPTANRVVAEQAAIVKVDSATGADDKARTLIGLLKWFEHSRALIDIEVDLAGLSNADSDILRSQMDRAYEWLGLVGTAYRSRPGIATATCAIDAGDQSRPTVKIRNKRSPMAAP